MQNGFIKGLNEFRFTSAKINNLQADNINARIINVEENLTLNNLDIGGTTTGSNFKNNFLTTNVDHDENDSGLLIGYKESGNDFFGSLFYDTNDGKFKLAKKATNINDSITINELGTLVVNSIEGDAEFFNFIVNNNLTVNGTSFFKNNLDFQTLSGETRFINFRGGEGNVFNTLAYEFGTGTLINSSANIGFNIDTNGSNENNRSFIWKKGTTSFSGGTELMRLREDGILEVLNSVGVNNNVVVDGSIFCLNFKNLANNDVLTFSDLDANFKGNLEVDENVVCKNIEVDLNVRCNSFQNKNEQLILSFHGNQLGRFQRNLEIGNGASQSSHLYIYGAWNQGGASNLKPNLLLDLINDNNTSNPTNNSGIWYKHYMQGASASASAHNIFFSLDNQSPNFFDQQDIIWYVNGSTKTFNVEKLTNINNNLLINNDLILNGNNIKDSTGDAISFISNATKIEKNLILGNNVIRDGSNTSTCITTDSNGDVSVGRNLEIPNILICEKYANNNGTKFLEIDGTTAQFKGIVDAEEEHINVKQLNVNGLPWITAEYNDPKIKVNIKAGPSGAGNMTIESSIFNSHANVNQFTSPLTTSHKCMAITSNLSNGNFNKISLGQNAGLNNVELSYKFEGNENVNNSAKLNLASYNGITLRTNRVDIEQPLLIKEATIIEDELTLEKGLNFNKNTPQRRIVLAGSQNWSGGSIFSINAVNNDGKRFGFSFNDGTFIDDNSKVSLKINNTDKLIVENTETEIKTNLTIDGDLIVNGTSNITFSQADIIGPLELTQFNTAVSGGNAIYIKGNSTTNQQGLLSATADNDGTNRSADNPAVRLAVNHSGTSSQFVLNVSPETAGLPESVVRYVCFPSNTQRWYDTGVNIIMDLNDARLKVPRLELTVNSTNSQSNTLYRVNNNAIFWNSGNVAVMQRNNNNFTIINSNPGASASGDLQITYSHNLQNNGSVSTVDDYTGWFQPRAPNDERLFGVSGANKFANGYTINIYEVSGSAWAFGMCEIDAWIGYTTA